MSVSAPAVVAPFGLDGGFDGVVQVYNPAGLAAGATVVLRSSTQPDKVCKIDSISGLKVRVVKLGVVAGQAVDASAFRVGDAAVLFMPAQTVTAIQGFPATTFTDVTATGDVAAGDDLTVADDATITGDAAVGGALDVTGAVNMFSSLGVAGAAGLLSTLAVTGAVTLSAAATVGTTLGVTGALTAGGVKALASRIQGAKGADVASAGTATLGADGNYFVVTGTTSIDYITKTGWQAGSEVTIMTSGSLTLKHNTGTVPGTAGALFLVGAADVSMTANDVIKLLFDGTLWRQSAPVVVV